MDRGSADRTGWGGVGQSHHDSLPSQDLIPWFRRIPAGTFWCLLTCLFTGAARGPRHLCNAQWRSWAWTLSSGNLCSLLKNNSWKKICWGQGKEKGGAGSRDQSHSQESKILSMSLETGFCTLRRGLKTVLPFMQSHWFCLWKKADILPDHACSRRTVYAHTCTLASTALGTLQTAYIGWPRLWFLCLDTSLICFSKVFHLIFWGFKPLGIAECSVRSVSLFSIWMAFPEGLVKCSWLGGSQPKGFFFDHHLLSFTPQKQQEDCEHSCLCWKAVLIAECLCSPQQGFSNANMHSTWLSH